MKRHLASQGIYNGGKRPFGFDVVGERLVPNEQEQAAIARMKALRESDKPLREISKTIAQEFKFALSAMSVKRILDRAAAA
jgi:putative DNA-invertase from lambdoid prophage Rac